MSAVGRPSLMKLYVDTSAKQVTVSREAIEKNDGQSGRQKQERGTGRLMWSTQVFVLDDDGGEVITVTTAGEKPCELPGRRFRASRRASGTTTYGTTSPACSSPPGLM